MNFIIDHQRGPHIRDYSDQSQDRVVICSNSGWWAAKGCGYTTRDMAGVYTRDDAYKRAGHCGPEKGCCFYDVPADHVPTLQAEVERLRGVIDRIGIGGNHLASALIGILGASDADFPPYTTPIEDIHLRIDDPNYRDLWICWAVMMRERDELRKEGVSQ